MQKKNKLHFYNMTTFFSAEDGWEWESEQVLRNLV